MTSVRIKKLRSKKIDNTVESVAKHIQDENAAPATTAGSMSAFSPEAFKSIVTRASQARLEVERFGKFEKDRYNIISEVKSAVLPEYILKNLNLEELKRLRDALEDFKAAIERSGVSLSSEVRKEIGHTAQDIVDTLSFEGVDDNEVNEAVELPKERWPTDKKAGEKAIDFLDRVWGPYIKATGFTRTELYDYDTDLYVVASRFYTRNRAAGKLDKIPDYLVEWFSARSYRTTEEMDEIISSLDLKEPRDAFSRGLPAREAHRVYAAMMRRQSST